MAPTLRSSTQRKTASSAKAAKDAGSKRKPRAPLARNQRYKRTKGLVSWRKSKKLDAMYVLSRIITLGFNNLRRRSTTANAETSPLLRLPAEIRNMIFKYASIPDWSSWIGCYFNERHFISRSAISSRAHPDEIQELAISLPRVCRQIYAETATLTYSENCFAFQSELAMHKWLNKRLVAQRESVRWMILPYRVYAGRVFVGNHWTFKPERDSITIRARVKCLNLVEMEENDWLDECLRLTRISHIFDNRSPRKDPSSGESFMYSSEWAY